MTQKLKNPHETPTDRVLLPRWMQLTAMLSVVVIVGILIFSLSDGADQTPIEQSPYRNAPEEVLAPGG